MSPITDQNLATSVTESALADRPETILQRLALIPGKDEALALILGRSNSAGGEVDTTLIETLHGIRQRLLAEASPDYWVEELLLGDDQLSANQMDIAVDAASVRLEEAAAVAILIDELENSAAAQTQGVGTTYR